ncbi:P-loop containing nucleoside triphosphate hydrolase protein [Boletus edulis BED1]|uniref:RNA helicase n=1 Tax=Boletus edulis BED1 TaxID=1328754 RepID=A0AAD4C1T3_BOLED|nr:P-loop containing nucleoside triphosphate hydrolase protein [Boletus edulis BED1]
MAPRAGKGIVRSGNAGNSSKNSSKPSVPQATSLEDKPLFPPGSKYPLSLLHERCQKNGWEKPTVDTRQHGDGWTFIVSLSKVNKRTSQRETVRFEPHPPYTRPTALEARHWGATYALYRFCNGMQLNRVLPPGPREYWSELAAQHKTVPEHQRWMYDADPFAARKEVEERQAKAAQKKDQKVTGFRENTLKSSNSPEFTQVPEVRMSSTLRDLVEDTVKKGRSVFYPSHEATPLVLAEDDVHAVTQQLRQLGFQPNQIQNAISYLSGYTPLGSHLLGSLAPLEACIEYLLLHIAETDLPKRFFPSNNSSNPFVVSGHSGADNLKNRWIEDLAIKEAGFPPHAVKEYTADPILAENLVLLISALSCRLIGKHAGELFKTSANLESSCHELRDRTDELEALGAHFVDSCHIVMPLFSAPVELHVVLPPDACNNKSLPAVYVGSKSVPPYIRLHLLAQLLCATEGGDFIEPGEGFLIAAMRVLEDHWAQIDMNGPPEMSTVVGHLITAQTTQKVPSISYDGPIDKENKRTIHRKPRHPYDDRSDEQVKRDFENVCQTRIYTEMLVSRQRLPAFSVKDRFLDVLDKRRTVVVMGETGCGKTTQLPQFILDALIQTGHGSKASIIVTQPRRISALSVAARVSAERADDGSVGYAIRGESKQDKRTKLLFCTTGVLLRRLGSGDKLENVTHVIVDEVHERSVDGDFLLLELRELLLRHDTLKVVLMSATINHEIFVKYFDNAPLLTIPGFTHPVEDRYLEDFIDLLHYVAPTKRSVKGQNDKEYEDTLRSRGLSEQGVSSIRNIIAAGHIDYQLISTLVKYITSAPDIPAGILIFLPGVEEIRQCITAISNTVVENEVDIYPLHANLTSEEQRRVFKASKKWKIVVATNVAETSITIDDVVYVIDGGKVKETSYNPDTGLSTLTEQWTARAAARQRRGRAGRTKPGVCYKLYTRKHEENMSSFPVPEILRIPLESISLMVKVTRENEDHFLEKAIDPPDVSAMDKAWSTLQELGAVDKESKLTALGRYTAMLPLDLRLGKMLVLGLILRCLDPVLTIVASLSSKPLFASPFDKREAATQARLRFDKHNSDLLTDVHAYNECIRFSDKESRGTFRSFCEEASASLLNFISTNAVHEITSLRQDFFSSLLDMGLTAMSSTPTSANLNLNSTNTNLIKAVILGGLWPRVARVHLPSSAIKFDKVQAGTVQRENAAKEYKMYDLKNGRVFLHPSSVLFGESTWKSPFLAYFQMQQTTKVFVRGATEVPVYALLLFGGPVTVNHVGGRLAVGSGRETFQLRAWPRIGTLVNQLRRLLEAQLQGCIEQGLLLGSEQDSLISNAITALLEQDGLTGH